MTNLEALQSVVDYDNTNLLSKVLIDNELTGAATYDKSLSDQIELCKAFVFDAMLSTPDFSEGSLSLKYDKNFLIQERDRIFIKNGISKGMAIEDATNLW